MGELNKHRFQLTTVKNNTFTIIDLYSKLHFRVLKVNRSLARDCINYYNYSFYVLKKKIDACRVCPENAQPLKNPILLLN